jgi:outer membrane protein assembly factor BamB
MSNSIRRVKEHAQAAAILGVVGAGDAVIAATSSPKPMATATAVIGGGLLAAAVGFGRKAVDGFKAHKAATEDVFDSDATSDEAIEGISPETVAAWANRGDSPKKEVTRPLISVDGRTVFTSSRNEVLAFDLKTGDLKWKAEISIWRRDPPSNFPPMVSASGTRVIYSNKERLSGFDTFTGKREWSHEVKDGNYELTGEGKQLIVQKLAAFPSVNKYRRAVIDIETGKEVI